MRPKKSVILFASVTLSIGIMLTPLAWSGQAVRPTPGPAAYGQPGAGTLSMELERTFRSFSYADDTLYPGAINDPFVGARLERFDVALRDGLHAVRGLAEGYDRADKARALAGCAMGVATVLWHSAFEAAAVGSSLDARRLWAWARRINDLGGELIDAAGTTLSPIQVQDLAQLRAQYAHNRENLITH